MRIVLKCPNRQILQPLCFKENIETRKSKNFLLKIEHFIEAKKPTRQLSRVVQKKKGKSMTETEKLDDTKLAEDFKQVSKNLTEKSKEKLENLDKEMIRDVVEEKLDSSVNIGYTPEFVNLDLIAFRFQESRETKRKYANHRWIQNILLKKDVESGCVNGIRFCDDTFLVGKEYPKQIIQELKFDKEFIKDMHTNTEHYLQSAEGMPIKMINRDCISFTADFNPITRNVFNIKNFEVIKDDELVDKIQKIIDKQNKES